MKDRIIYYNLNYKCDNKCVYCYSHNTYNKSVKIEIDTGMFLNYSKKLNIDCDDYLIFNGGEPLLSSNIIDIINESVPYVKHVDVFTNGKNLFRLKDCNLLDNVSFIIPIHGNEQIHDKITQTKGSYSKTIANINYIHELHPECNYEIKFIFNHLLLMQPQVISEMFDDILNLHCVNTIHLTKMIDTVVSRENNIDGITFEQASLFTEYMFNKAKWYMDTIKIYDNCPKCVLDVNNVRCFQDCGSYSNVVFIDVYGKKDIETTDRSHCKIYKQCNYKEYCNFSEYSFHILKYNNGNFIKTWC